LNNRGEVVGYSETSNSELHAFLYANGQIRDLGALPGGTQSLAYGLNNVGQIVGAADDAAGGLRAVLYDGVRLRNLNTLVRNGAGWVLRVATAINDGGEIVGEGAFQGEEHAFLLTPETVPRGKSLSSTTVSLKESRREPK
jgi:probable HAF family extracellular repeat protein